ncbi:hypothetical protein [Dactylosporangium sp. NPDC050588]|uniref:hypothetical protein n=1 Tax=Dactylosporangium sp. NPDC050588 TaxID=3157211 RepID=UPI0033EA7D9D
MGALVVVALAAAGGSTVLRKERTAPSAPSVVVPVTGVLLEVGGPGDIPPRGVAGTVRLRAADGTVTEAVAATGGRFNLSVPPGRYIATGAPRGYVLNDPSSEFVGGPSDVRTGSSSDVVTFPDNARPPMCAADAPIAVPSGGLDDVQVICQIR